MTTIRLGAIVLALFWLLLHERRVLGDRAEEGAALLGGQRFQVHRVGAPAGHRQGHRLPLRKLAEELLLAPGVAGAALPLEALHAQPFDLAPRDLAPRLWRYVEDEARRLHLHPKILELGEIL